MPSETALAHPSERLKGKRSTNTDYLGLVTKVGFSSLCPVKTVRCRQLVLFYEHGQKSTRAQLGFKARLFVWCLQHKSLFWLFNLEQYPCTTRLFLPPGFTVGLFSCNNVFNIKKDQILWILTCKFHLQQSSDHTVHKNCFPWWRLKNNNKMHDIIAQPHESFFAGTQNIFMRFSAQKIKHSTVKIGISFLQSKST